jgi:hypothetical protein
MADTPTAEKPAFDWSKITVHASKRLRAPKVPPVPDAIVALAQASWDGVPDPEDAEGESLHVLRHEFSDEAVAKEFAKHMKNAGAHTTPLTSVTVVPDPEKTGNVKLVAWRAGTRRGKQTTK